MKKTKWIWIWAAIGLILGIIIFWPSNRGNKEAILEASAVEEVVDTTEQHGTIYDSNGKVLAESASVWQVVMSPANIDTDKQMCIRDSLCCNVCSDYCNYLVRRY